jgi:hypothetical protein
MNNELEKKSVIIYLTYTYDMHLETLNKSSRFYKLCEGRLIISSKCEYTIETKSVTDKAGYDERHLRTDLYGQTYRVYTFKTLRRYATHAHPKLQ